MKKIGLKIKYFTAYSIDIPLIIREGTGGIMDVHAYWGLDIDEKIENL